MEGNYTESLIGGISVWVDSTETEKQLALSYNAMVEACLIMHYGPDRLLPWVRSKVLYYRNKVVDSSYRRLCKFVHYMKFKHILKRK
jgi:hypothetical protein